MNFSKTQKMMKLHAEEAKKVGKETYQATY